MGKVLDLVLCSLFTINASYLRLSSSFKAVTANLSYCYPVARTVQEASAVPKWNEAIYEEMRALKRTILGNLLIFHHKRG